MARVLRAGAALALVASFFPSWPAQAATFTYPSSAPCNSTLQACINGIASGSILEIATNTPIDQDSVTINKSLTLRPAAGFDPVITGDDPAVPDYFFMYESGLTSVDISVVGIEFTHMRISISSGTGSGHRFRFENNSVTFETDSAAGSGLDVNIHVPSETILRRNHVSTTGTSIHVGQSNDTGVAKTLVQGNIITSTNALESGGGLVLRVDGAAPATIDAYNNVVHRVAGCMCGGSSGIELVALGAGDARINLVNNTVHNLPEGGSGILVYPMTGTGDRYFDIFNNTVSRAEARSLWFPDAAARMRIRADYNNMFDSGAPALGGYSAGPHSMSVAPRFVDPGAGNFRLEQGSGLRDRGDICQPGGLPRSDARGKFRVVRRSVDVGAYEYGSSRRPPPGKNIFGTRNGETLNGTGGVDIICAFGGGDDVNGGRRGDRIFGGGGMDRLVGRVGPDVIYAGKGRDFAAGGIDRDFLHTKDGRGDDSANGGSGNDRCRTDPGDTRSSC